MYPGKALDDILKMYPPVFIWTQEFDHLRRDNVKFAERLKNVGKLVDISITPGCMHATMGHNYKYEETTIFRNEEKLAFDMLVR